MISPMIFIIFPWHFPQAFPLGHRTIFMASHAKDSQYFFTSGSGAWAPDFPQIFRSKLGMPGDGHLPTIRGRPNWVI